MIETRKGPAILGGATVPPDLCAPLSAAIKRVLDFSFGEPGRLKVTADDVILLDFQAQMLAVAEAVSAGRQPSMQVIAGADTSAVRTCEHLSSSQQEPVWLGTEDAAVVMGTCARTVRREIDRGVVTATQDSRGHLVDLQSAIAYRRAHSGRNNRKTQRKVT